jgi:hypothetical protein
MNATQQKKNLGTLANTRGKSSVRPTFELIKIEQVAPKNIWERVKSFFVSSDFGIEDWRRIEMRQTQRIDFETHQYQGRGWPHV